MLLPWRQLEAPLCTLSSRSPDSENHARCLSHLIGIAESARFTRPFQSPDNTMARLVSVALDCAKRIEAISAGQGVGENPTLQPLKLDQKQAAAQTLAVAFSDDPLMEILVPEDVEKRRALAPAFFSAFVDYGARWGKVFSNDDASAVAIWFPPEATHLTFGRMMRAGMGGVLLKLGAKGSLGFMTAMSSTEKLHKAVPGPHWYLAAIGTRPALQGKGLGSALVEAGTALADAARIPCYLETGTQSNIDFYTKRGFTVSGEVIIKGFTVTGMVRPALASSLSPTNHAV